MRERIANYVIMADLVAKNRREGRWLVTVKSSSLKIEMPSYSSMHKVGLPWVLEGGGEGGTRDPLVLQFKRFDGGKASSIYRAIPGLGIGP